MIDKIAYELVKSISTNVGFIDKWAGLVKPMRKMVQKTEKVFPVAINTPSNCDQSDYTAFVPDDTKRSVAYIEMIQSPTVDVIRHGSRQLSAQLRLVVWYNLDRITVGKYVSEDMLVDQIFRSLPRRLNNSLFNGASQVHVMSTGVTYGAEVVSQYTYNEVKSQFVTHPYGIFAIDLDVWYITTYCQSPFDIEAGCTTGKGNHNNYLTVPSLSDLDAEIVGDNIVFSVVVDTGHSNTTLTLFWGETELTMTNEVSMGEFTENGTFTFPLPTDYFGVDDIFWLIKATNLNGSVNSDIQGSNVNPPVNEAEVDTYITGLVTPLSGGQITKLNTLVRALKTGLGITNLSDAFDVLYLLSGETAESSLKNLVKNAHHATAVNSPTFTQFEGFAGNGTTSYIRTNYIPSTQAVNVALNSATIMNYVRTDSNGNFVDSGAAQAGSGINLQSRYNDRFYGRIWNDTNLISPVIGNAFGLNSLSRTASNLTTAYKHKTSIGTNTADPIAVTTRELYISALNNIGTGYGYTSRQQSMFAIGQGFNATEIGIIADAIEAYMDSNGKGVIA